MIRRSRRRHHRASSSRQKDVQSLVEQYILAKLTDYLSRQGLHDDQSDQSSIIQESLSTRVQRDRTLTGQRKNSKNTGGKTLEDVLLCAGLNDRLLFYLRPDDLMALCVVNKVIHVQLKRYIIYAFSINKLLLPFFDDPAAFRCAQAETGAIISGSTALQFFERIKYDGSDLDIYVEDRYARPILDFILQNQYIADYGPAGGEPVPGPEYIVPGIARYIRFTNGVRKIEVMTTRCSPMKTILGFHSTCVMNVITHQRAYAIFPHATFVRKLSLVTKNDTSERFEIAKQKYLKRGWSMLDTQNSTTAVEASRDFSTGNRWIGDHLTWTIPLMPELRHLGNDMIPANSFSLRFNQYRNAFANDEFMVFDEARLKHQYTCSTYELPLFQSILSDLRQSVGVFTYGTQDEKFNSKLYAARESLRQVEAQN